LKIYLRKYIIDLSNEGKVQNMKFEKATYSRRVLNEGLRKVKSINITAKIKGCHYSIYFALKDVTEWLQDNAGNSSYFYQPYYLEQYRDGINNFSSTTKKELDRQARLAKREIAGMIQSVLQDGKTGEVNLV